MATRLLLSVFLFVISSFAQQVDQENICLWGHYDLNDRQMNGLYRRSQEQVDGKYYWKLDRSDNNCPGAFYYIYWYDTFPDNGWYIGLGTSDSFGFGLQSLLLAKCRNDKDILNNPVDCGPNWSLGIGQANDPFPSSNIKTNFVATWGRCPALDCQQITVTSNGINACIGTATQTGANQYSGGTWVWWFNQPTFQWLCTPAAVVGDTCNTFTSENGNLFNLAPAQLWQDLSNDGQFFVYDDSYGAQGRFTCEGDGTTTTYSPTTKYPTMPEIPTPFPTFKPISFAAPTMPGSGTGTGGNGDDDDNNNGGDDDGSGGGDGSGGDGSGGSGSGGGGGDDDDDDKSSVFFGDDGKMKFPMILIIIILAICCCCCIIGGIIYARKKKSGHEQYFGGNDL